MYYYHEASRHAQYSRPSVDGGGERSLIGGWNVHRDASGKEYYWNEATYESRQEAPSEVVVASSGGRHEWDPPLPAGGLASTKLEGTKLEEGHAASSNGEMHAHGGGQPPAPNAFRPDDLQRQVVEVEKEAMRLRSLLADAQISWERGVMKAPVGAKAQGASDSRLAAPVLRAESSEASKAAKADAAKAAAESNRAAQERWARRQEVGRHLKGQKTGTTAALDRLAQLGEEALLQCGYAPEVMRIKTERRRPPSAAANNAGGASGGGKETSRQKSRPASAPIRGAAASSGDAGAAPVPGRASCATAGTSGSTGGGGSSKSEVAAFLSHMRVGGDPSALVAKTCDPLTHARFLGGSRGARITQFNHPAFVTMLPGGELCVADSGNARLQLLSAPDIDGKAPIVVKRVLQSRALGGKLIGPADRLQLGLGIACDRAKGVLFAADPAAGVRKLNLQPVGELLFDNKTSGEVELPSPEGMALSADGKLLAVSDSAKHQVVLFDATSLTHVRTFGRKGKAKGQLRSPDGVAIHDGSVYVADTLNHRISVFWLDGGGSAYRDEKIRAAVGDAWHMTRGAWPMARGACHRSLSRRLLALLQPRGIHRRRKLPMPLPCTLRCHASALLLRPLPLLASC